MSTKIKGIYKGFKFISQIFVVNTKEHEIEIGYPTDVKHMTHIGWDSASGSAPSWMNEFKPASDYAATSIGNISETRGPTWSSQDIELVEPTTETFKEALPIDPAKATKNHRRKKNKPTNSPKSLSSSRSSRPTKSKSKFVEGSAIPVNIKVVKISTWGQNLST